jgi:hypothetical protein
MADSDMSSVAVLAEIADAFVISINYRPACGTAAEALCAVGLPAQAPDACSQIPVSGGCFARLSPYCGIVVTRDRAFSAKVIDGLRPGLCDSAMAIDVSEGHSVLALSGGGWERLLATATDPAAPADTTRTACNCRVSDVKATLLRLDHRNCWLVVESSLAGHLAGHFRRAIEITSLPRSAKVGEPRPASRER